MATWRETRQKANATVRQKANAPVKKKSVEKPQQNKDINTTFDVNKTYLVVNGKAKEISNKSKYLLDMLIINQED